MGLPVQVKEAVLKKVLMGNRPHHDVALEFGIGRSTIGKWLREYKQTGNMNLNSKEKRPKDWTATERLSALIKTGAMSVEGLTSWCRKKGIFTHHLEQWKKDAGNRDLIPGQKQGFFFSQFQDNLPATHLLPSI